MQDLRDNGNHRSLQFAEKGGKAREILVHHDLDEWIQAYIEGAGLAEAPKASPLLRAVIIEAYSGQNSPEPTKQPSKSEDREPRPDGFPSCRMLRDGDRERREK